MDKDQKQFIKKNVKKLGSIEAVKKLYNKDCEVDKFAVKEAEKIYN